MERLQNGQEDDHFREPNFSVSFEEAVTDSAKRPLYRDERVEAIKEGHLVWMAYGIGVASGPNHCLYHEGQQKGLVHGDEKRGYLPLMFVESEGKSMAQSLVSDTIGSLSEAKQLLVDTLRKTRASETAIDMDKSR